ncbi:MAG: RNA polymerase sigma factor [Myxococcales bacterium]|nr:RNA polymerase sigma factor [Myxococcales bacterium]
MKDCADEPLLRRLAKGQPTALEEFYDQQVDGLYAHLYYRVGRDQDLAEEAVQETFSRALSSLNSYDSGRGSLQVWLRTLSRNVVRDLLRSHNRSRDLIALWEQIDASLAQIFESLDKELLPPELLGREETRELVNMTVTNLPENYQQALCGKYVDGESVGELATKLNLSEKAAKSLLARARGAFRETFASLGRTLTKVSS